jgi:glycosyltransferase involved in cell wall biosynthesis
LEAHGLHGAPLLPNIGVLALVPDYWGGAWQVRHQVLTRLARIFNVVWINRPLGWRSYWLSKNNIHVPEKSGEMVIYNPGRWLPQLHRPSILADLVERERLRRAKKILHKRGCSHTVLYVWRPELGAALDMIKHDLSIYHIDDEYTFSPVEQQTSAEEHALIRRADQVFVHSVTMLAKKGHLNANTLLVENGVDFQAFATPVPEPEEMKGIPHPRIGYTGVIKDQLDFNLLKSLVTMHPEWSFVFVGPKGRLKTFGGIVTEMEGMQNVHFLGGKPVEVLPAYCQHFDVSMLCYVIDGYTKFISPLKINEYLATGRPVVGVPIPSIESLGNIIRIARTPEEWSEAITASLAREESEQSKVSARQAIASQYDWNQQTWMIAKAVCERLGNGYLLQLESAMDKSWDYERHGTVPEIYGAPMSL